MQHLAALRAIGTSFYSRDLYRQAARDWKGHGLLYLLLLLAITWLPSPIRWHESLATFVREALPVVAEQMPAVRIHGGELTTTPPGRHVMRDEKGTPFILIDDSLETVPDDAVQEGLVVTRREVGIIRPSRNERRIWKLSQVGNMELAPADVERFLRLLPPFLPVLGYLFCLVGSFAFRSVQILLYAAIARAWAKPAGTLDFKAAMRLAAVAVTPVVVLRTLIWFGPWEPSWLIRWPAAIAITLAYVWFGVRAASAASGTEQPVAAACDR